jgi:hypothetical protein
MITEVTLEKTHRWKKNFNQLHNQHHLSTVMDLNQHSHNSSHKPDDLQEPNPPGNI